MIEIYLHLNFLQIIIYFRKLKLSDKKIIMPKWGGGHFISRYPLVRQESGHKNNISCKGQPNVSVLKTKLKIIP